MDRGWTELVNFLVLKRKRLRSDIRAGPVVGEGS